MPPRLARHRLTALIVLAAGIAVAAGLAVVEASASDDARRRAEHSLGSDLVVTGPLDSTAVERLQLLRPVDLMTAGMTGPARVGGTEAKVVAWDDDGAAALLLSRTADAGFVDRVGAGELLLDRHTADDLGVTVGDRVPVSTPVGTRELRVTGIVTDSGLGSGNTVSWSDAPALFGDARPAVAHVKLAAATPVAGARDQVAGIVGGGATVRTRAEVVAAAEPIGPAPPPWVVMPVLVATVAVAALLLTRAAARSKRQGAADAGGAALLGAAAGIGGGAGVASLLGLETVVPWAWLAGFVVAGAAVGLAVAAIRSRDQTGVTGPA